MPGRTSTKTPAGESRPGSPSQSPPRAESPMMRTLALARRGEALTSPNPMVGAVLVRDGRTVGERLSTATTVCATPKSTRWRQRGSAARGATFYTLISNLAAIPAARLRVQRPSSRPGSRALWLRCRTPIRRSLGAASANFRAAKVAVEIGEQHQEARALKRSLCKSGFARASPFVTLKSALTQDGHLVLPPKPSRASRQVQTTALRKTCGSLRPRRVPRCNACGTHRTRYSRASAPFWRTIPSSRTGPDSHAAGHCYG